ncbi:MAG: FAD-binding oxidoreductase, partial [Bacteroidota bacterium]
MPVFLAGGRSENCDVSSSGPEREKASKPADDPEYMATIHSDSLSRYLYSTDASMYQELPSGVAWPESTDEIVELVRKTAETGGTITARSAGTSLAGQTTGSGVIMDVSRHMNRILSLDPEKREAWVQPGVIRDTLNRETANHGLQFGPDTSTT